MVLKLNLVQDKDESSPTRRLPLCHRTVNIATRSLNRTVGGSHPLRPIFTGAPPLRPTQRMNAPPTGKCSSLDRLVSSKRPTDINPRAVLFTHGDICDKMLGSSCHVHIDSVIDQVLKDGALPRWPPIPVVETSGVTKELELRAIDGNRRLYVARVAWQHGVISSVPVVICKLEEAGVSDKYRNSNSSGCGGVEVNVRESGSKYKEDLRKGREKQEHFEFFLYSIQRRLLEATNPNPNSSEAKKEAMRVANSLREQGMSSVDCLHRLMLADAEQCGISTSFYRHLEQALRHPCQVSMALAAQGWWVSGDAPDSAGSAGIPGKWALAGHEIIGPDDQILEIRRAKRESAGKVRLHVQSKNRHVMGTMIHIAGPGALKVDDLVWKPATLKWDSFGSLIPGTEQADGLPSGRWKFTTYFHQEYAFWPDTDQARSMRMAFHQADSSESKVDEGEATNEEFDEEGGQYNAYVSEIDTQEEYDGEAGSSDNQLGENSAMNGEWERDELQYEEDEGRDVYAEQFDMHSEHKREAALDSTEQKTCSQPKPSPSSAEDYQVLGSTEKEPTSHRAPFKRTEELETELQELQAKIKEVNQAEAGTPAEHKKTRAAATQAQAKPMPKAVKGLAEKKQQSKPVGLDGKPVPSREGQATWRQKVENRRDDVLEDAWGDSELWYVESDADGAAFIPMVVDHELEYRVPQEHVDHDCIPFGDRRPCSVQVKCVACSSSSLKLAICHTTGLEEHEENVVNINMPLFKEPFEASARCPDCWQHDIHLELRAHETSSCSSATPSSSSKDAREAAADSTAAIRSAPRPSSSRVAERTPVRPTKAQSASTKAQSTFTKGAAAVKRTYMGGITAEPVLQSSKARHHECSPSSRETKPTEGAVPENAEWLRNAPWNKPAPSSRYADEEMTPEKGRRDPQDCEHDDDSCEGDYEWRSMEAQKQMQQQPQTPPSSQRTKNARSTSHLAQEEATERGNLEEPDSHFGQKLAVIGGGGGPLLLAVLYDGSSIFSEASNLVDEVDVVGDSGYKTVDSSLQARIAAAFASAGGQWEGNHWQVVRALGNVDNGQPVIAVGVGSNKKARERAAKLALALTLHCCEEGRPGRRDWCDGFRELAETAKRMMQRRPEDEMSRPAKQRRYTHR